MIQFISCKPERTCYDSVIIKKWLSDVAKRENKKIGELIYICCNDEQILDINRKYLQHDYYTDIITFPNSVNPRVLNGEIYISLESVQSNAKNLKINLEQELLRVIIHGLLHLIGYNDTSPLEKSVMRSKEDYYLHLLPNFN